MHEYKLEIGSGVSTRHRKCLTIWGIQMRGTVFTAVLFAAFTAFAGSVSFPKGPNQELTPGDVCHNPDSYRYEERIAYCERDVDPKLKAQIIKQYDRELGYSVGSMPRGKFKIDHYIPLCMGGSNEAINLWPQHESVYKVTDPLEQVLCEKMADGRLLQAEAIDMIKRAKKNLDEAPMLLEKAESL